MAYSVAINPRANLGLRLVASDDGFGSATITLCRRTTGAVRSIVRPAHSPVRCSL